MTLCQLVAQIWLLYNFLFTHSSPHVLSIFIKVKQSLSRVQLFVTLWTIQSMEFSRPEYWSGYSFPSSQELPNPGIEPRSPTLQVDSLSAEPQGELKNTGVGSLSLLQQIFATQESIRVSCIANRFFTNWAIRDIYLYNLTALSYTWN